MERHTDTSGWRRVRYILKSQNKHALDTRLLRRPTLSLFKLVSLLLLSGVSVCQLITECIYSSLFLCRLCGESHSISQTMWKKWVSVFTLVAIVYLFCVPSPVSISLFTPARSVLGQPCSHSTKPARWLVVTTTSQAACSSPGSATIRAGSPPTRYTSTSGTPCRMCSPTVPIPPCSSLTCRYPDHMGCFSIF